MAPQVVVWVPVDPMGRHVDEDPAYTHLQMAARYLQKMTTLEAHFGGLGATSA